MNGIYFAYEKEKLILKNVDFELEKGDFVSLIGGNGVGKSTFLQLLGGILKPIKGKVRYKKGIKLAYVHQNPMIHFSKDNVKEEFLESILESKLLFSLHHVYIPMFLKSFCCLDFLVILLLINYLC